jgi:hypothetical protein
MSDSWLELLVTDAAAPFYAELTYDGRITFEPSNPRECGDHRGRWRHHRRTTDLDPIRPAAAIRTIATFEALHYSVVKVAPGWVPDCVASSKMLAALVDGWPGTAREVGPQSLPEIATRLTHRRDALSHEKSSIRVGRIDVFAAPIARR